MLAGWANGKPGPKSSPIPVQGRALRRGSRSSRNNYVTTYKRSQVLSVRLSPDELSALRLRARAEGRSVSGEVAFLVKERVAERAAYRAKPPRKISGWLAHLHAPDAHAEFRTARSDASAQLIAAVRRKRQRAAGK
jgi:hypothetical protein